jgi:hypothetical protein
LRRARGKARTGERTKSRRNKEIGTRFCFETHFFSRRPGKSMELRSAWRTVATTARQYAAKRGAKADSRVARIQARAEVERWNDQIAKGQVKSPTIRAAISAEMTWLKVRCPRCGKIQALDLRKINPHPSTSVATLCFVLRCLDCRAPTPMPELIGLHALPPGDR